MGGNMMERKSIHFGEEYTPRTLQLYSCSHSQPAGKEQTALFGMPGIVQTQRCKACHKQVTRYSQSLDMMGT